MWLTIKVKVVLVHSRMVRTGRTSVVDIWRVLCFCGNWTSLVSHLFIPSRISRLGILFSYCVPLNGWRYRKSVRRPTLVGVFYIDFETIFWVSERPDFLVYCYKLCSSQWPSVSSWKEPFLTRFLSRGFETYNWDGFRTELGILYVRTLI